MWNRIISPYFSTNEIFEHVIEFQRAFAFPKSLFRSHSLDTWPGIGWAAQIWSIVLIETILLNKLMVTQYLSFSSYDDLRKQLEAIEQNTSIFCLDFFGTRTVDVRFQRTLNQPSAR